MNRSRIVGCVLILVMWFKCDCQPTPPNDQVGKEPKMDLIGNNGTSGKNDATLRNEDKSLSDQSTNGKVDEKLRNLLSKILYSTDDRKKSLNLILAVFERDEAEKKTALKEREKERDNERDKKVESNIRLNIALDAAGNMEFINLYRNQMVGLEKHYTKGMPSDDAPFLEKFRTPSLKNQFENISDEKILGKKHFRIWLWLLTFGDEKVFTQLSKLRNLLEHDVNKYLWFADATQRVFDFLNEDVHLIGREMDIKFMDKSKIPKYISYLADDVQKAASIFFASEGWLPNPNATLKAKS